jgi:hypothetical protein
MILGKLALRKAYYVLCRRYRLAPFAREQNIDLREPAHLCVQSFQGSSRIRYQRLAACTFQVGLPILANDVSQDGLRVHVNTVAIRIDRNHRVSFKETQTGFVLYSTARLRKETYRNLLAMKACPKREQVSSWLMAALVM